MTDTIGGARCKYCWRPEGYRALGEGFHNEGCPDGVPAGKFEKQEWERGYAYGFADNNIPHWKQSTDFYSAPFLLGYRVGKDEIDQAVEQAVETRDHYGEWD